MDIFKLFRRSPRTENKVVINFEKLKSNKNISNIKEFIAVDIETTGLSPYEDKILEIAAVHYKEGKVVDEFNMLINPRIPISTRITSINGIDNEMVRNELDECEVIRLFYNFLKLPIEREIIFCAHNANFDFGFLEYAFKRSGISITLKYADTLQLSRKYIKNIRNYKQTTLEEYFNVENKNSHRALSDAKACAQIFEQLIKISESRSESTPIMFRNEKNIPTNEELQVCAYIQYLLKENGIGVETISFYRNSSKYVDARVNGVYFLRFKMNQKRKYIICKKEKINLDEFIYESCTETEGGANYVRIFFSNPSLLRKLQEYILESYDEGIEAWQNILEYGLDENYEEYLSNSTILDDIEVDKLLKEAEKIDELVDVKIKEKIKIDQIILTKKMTRIALSEIENIDNWKKGFEKGFSFYEEGEFERKAGNISDSIYLFDKARSKGYNSPALYKSYALAYRKIKDYENEILILQEGIERDEGYRGSLEARLDKAIELLYKKQNPKK